MEGGGRGGVKSLACSAARVAGSIHLCISRGTYAHTRGAFLRASGRGKGRRGAVVQSDAKGVKRLCVAPQPGAAVGM
jgi:hypothetical protein